MSKTSGKREKSACASMGHLPKLQNIKNGGWREWRGRRVRLHEGKDLNFVVTSNLPLIFTKLPLWAAELQKCHYWTSHVGPFTQMTWK